MNKLIERAGDERLVRGLETRKRLIEAGVRLFGVRGFDHVTTRDLATAARCNQAAILYHFQGKEQVYRAVAEHVAEHTRARLIPSLPPASERALPGAADRLAKLMETICRVFLGLSESGYAAFIVREQTTPGLGFEALYEGWMRETHECVTELVAAATGANPDDEATIIRAHALLGLALSFAVTRAVLQKRLRRRSFSPEQAEVVVREVAGLVRSALAGDPPKPPRRPSRRRG
jgi:AcrR family transcriptional regulator